METIETQKNQVHGLDETLDYVLTCDDVAKFLKVDVSSIYRWIRAGYFPRGHQLGSRKSRRWTRDEVKAWLLSK